jgi:cystathionine beta-lyase/cystathionine gamma-synthase
MKSTKLNTRIVHAGYDHKDDETGAVMPPIYSSSIYAYKELGGEQKYVYSRAGNPTREAYEKCIADLEDGKHGFAFASGMAAISTIVELLDANSHIIVSDNVYGGSYRLFETVRNRTANLSCSYVDMTDVENIEAAIKPNTRMIWVESPTNPLLQIIDLTKVAQIAREHKLLSVIDNTFATPWMQQPLKFGFDIVLHSTTKYLNGHSDVIGGVVVVGDNAELAEKLHYLQKVIGAVPSPFDCYLALRGVRTLAIRMERHCANALELARWLEKQPQVSKVFYPGLESHPQHTLAKKQMRAFGGIISLYLNGGLAETERFLKACELFVFTGSLGGVESLIAHPITMSHASLSAEMKSRLGITENLVRISVGIEDVEDLRADLAQALLLITNDK